MGDEKSDGVRVRLHSQARCLDHQLAGSWLSREVGLSSRERYGQLQKCVSVHLKVSPLQIGSSCPPILHPRKDSMNDLREFLIVLDLALVTVVLIVWLIAHL